MDTDRQREREMDGAEGGMLWGNGEIRSEIECECVRKSKIEKEQACERQKGK